MTIEGAVTALPGRVLRSDVTFLQDGTGGIAVQLPDGVPTSGIRLGTILRVSGRLADPYANLELRPTAVTDIVTAGDGGVPSAVAVGSTDLTESREGILVRANGVVSRVETGSAGSIAVTLRDGAGEMRVFLFGTLGLDRGDVPVGATLRVTGIVGQRESSSGAGDGYRLWPRDRSDVSVTVASPTLRPGATARPGSTPRPTDRPRSTASPAPALVRIAAAAEGATVTIQGTVTSRVGLFDSDERRLTLQDGSGAILVRLPDGAAQPKVGARLKVRGEVGTWFSARQLEADESPSVSGTGSTQPIVLRRAPSERDEWRLVRVTVRITDVTKDGDTWRAEASLGAAGTLPIVGVARSGISADALVEGRNATITGIVKRAHPSATDQRFGIAPRDASDIRLGPAPRGTTGSGTGGSSSTSSGDDLDSDGDGGGADPQDDQSASGVDQAAVSASLRSASGMLGRRVRVAGALRLIETPLLTLDDGSGRGLVRLLDFEPVFQPPLHLGEVVNVTGTVASRDLGGWEIVASADGVVRAANLALPTATPTAAGPFAVLVGPSPSPGNGYDGLAGTDDPSAGAPPADLGRLLLAVAVGLVVAGLVTVGGALALRSSRRRAAGPGGRRADQG